MHDDPAIDSTDAAYRRVLHSEAFVEWDGNRREWLPTNAAMRDPRGGSEISVYLQSRLAATEGPGDVAALRPGSIVFSASVSDVRTLGFGVTHQPDQDIGPLRHAHGSINGNPAWTKPEYRTQRNELVRGMTLAFGQISLDRRGGA